MGSPIIVREIFNEICSYGCGQPAKVEFKNKKFCCSKSMSACPTVKLKNSMKQLGNQYKTGKTQVSWNTGLTKETDERLLRISLLSKGKIGTFKGKRHSKETKEKISAIMAEKMKNRYTASKREEYNGIKLESSWEVILAKDLDANNIKWTRPAPLLWRDDAGQLRRYYPDFYLIDYNIYLDPKNSYVQKLDKRKFELVIEQNKIKLFMLNKHQLNWKIIESEMLR